MRIVFTTNQIFLHGGIEKVLTEKANYFAEVYNYEVTIATTQQQNKPPCYPLSNKVKLIDLGINYNKKKSFFHYFNISKSISHFNRSRKSLKLINPDFVIVANFDFDFFWIPFIHKASKKIKEYHSSQYMRQEVQSSVKNNLLNRIVEFIEKKYDAVVVLNKDEQSFFKSSNTYVIPNPISIPEYRSSLDKKQVLAAGRIAPVKGFERLIEAWSFVVVEHPDWILHIYGEDYLDTKYKLQEQIKRYRITNNVFFRGVSKNMTETMLDYSLYLMTSHMESFSMVIVEALSVGLPTIAFDVPTGPRNLIRNEVDGILVVNNDIDGYVRKVKELILDTQKRKSMGAEAKSSSIYYATGNIMNMWSELFENI